MKVCYFDESGTGAEPVTGPHPPSDAIPSNLAADIFRLSEHLDGLAYAIAELSHVYAIEGDGCALRPLSKKELEGGLFQDGARCLSFIDGRPTISNLAVSAKAINKVIYALVAALDGTEEPR